MDMIPKGTPVRQRVQPFEGVVDDVELDKEKGTLRYHVVGEKDGERHAVWFAASDVESIPAKTGSELKKGGKA